MSRARPSRRAASAGLSLVELMVAVTVGLILLAGAISIFLGNKRTYEVTEGLSRLQENARFALDRMIWDLRMAGFHGCSGTAGAIAVLPALNKAPEASGEVWNPTHPLEGLAAGGAVWLPGNDGTTALPANLAAGSDAVTVRYLEGPGFPITANLDAGATVFSINATVPSDWDRRLAAVADCGSADLFQLAENGIGVNSITAVQGLTRPFEDLGPTLPALTDRRYPAVMRLRAVRYYVGDTGREGLPALFVETYAPATLAPVQQELLEGVEAMRILYGQDQTGDGVPDAYLNATELGTNANAWRGVRAIRLGLLFRTINPSGTQNDAGTYNLFTGARVADPGDCEDPGCVTPVALRVQRRVFTTTISVRNF